MNTHTTFNDCRAILHGGPLDGEEISLVIPELPASDGGATLCGPRVFIAVRETYLHEYHLLTNGAAHADADSSRSEPRYDYEFSRSIPREG